MCVKLRGQDQASPVAAPVRDPTKYVAGISDFLPCLISYPGQEPRGYSLSDRSTLSYS